MQTYWQAIRSFNSSVWRYVAMWGLFAFSYFGCIGVLQNLYLLRLGYDVESIGLLIASGQLVWAIAAFPAAMIGRRAGPKRALMLSLGLNAIAFAFFNAVEALPVPIRPAWLVTWNTVVWVAIALFVVNSTPYLAGLTRPEQRSYAFAMQAAMIPLAAFAGGLIAGQLPGLFVGLFGDSLDQPTPYRYGLWLVPVAYVLALFIISRAQSVSLNDEARSQQESTRPPAATLVIFGLIATLFCVGEGVTQAFFNVYLDLGLGLPPAQIGAIIGIASLLPVAAALTSAPLMKRLGAGATLGLASVGMGTCLAVMALLPTVLAAAIGRMATRAMSAIGGAARNVFSQEIVPLRWRTTSSAVSTIGLALGWALAAAIGGALIRVIGFSGVFLLGGLLTLLSPVLMFAFLRGRRAHTPVPTVSTTSLDIERGQSRQPA